MPQSQQMEWLDYVVLAVYFLMMIGIGVYTSRRIKKQEDYFMGGRGFGKLLQTFAAFGAGTGSNDPVVTGRTTFISGMSGMWGVMYWLFVTPFYWITGVWYRRMRHLTLGDWFVERYESRAIGVGYAIFGLGFFIVYGSLMFSAIGKVAAPLIGFDAVVLDAKKAEIEEWDKKEALALENEDAGARAAALERLGERPLPWTLPIEYILVPIIGVVVLTYGIAGGLEAAYYTDLVQGMCIILLSIILIPFGLWALVEKFGDPETQSLLAGFTIMHQQLPEEHFSIIGTSTSEFPWYRIVAVVIINLVGIVVQPHFIATGGGSAKTETNARVGLVTGNFLKRFCTVGWVLTALIALALFADNVELNNDPDKTWGVASLNLLWPGLTGLMLACLLAALMSSADAYMVVGSALVVRNIYAPYINNKASEKQYVRVGRITGAIIIIGAVAVSLSIMNVFQQLQLTWIFGVLFAAPFWIGMYWRRATAGAAWTTVLFSAVMFFGVPFFLPLVYPQMRTNPAFLMRNDIVRTTVTREAAPSDLSRRRAWNEGLERALAVKNDQKMRDALAKAGMPRPVRIGDGDAGQEWIESYQSARDGGANLSAALQTAGDVTNDAAWKTAFLDIIADKDAQKVREGLAALGPIPVGEEGDRVQETTTMGGDSVFWEGGVKPVDEKGAVLSDVAPEPLGTPERIGEETEQVVLDYAGGDVTLAGQGNFKFDFLLYKVTGVPLRELTGAQLSTLELPVKIVSPFLVMILVSLITPRNRKESLDRYYAKMKTPVDPDPEKDQQKLEESYRNPERMEAKKLFPGTSLEFQKPSLADVLGFVICFGICFAIIGLAIWIAQIGA